MRPSEKWEDLAEVLRAIEPDLEMKLAYCRANPVDPVEQPVTCAVVAAYISLVELELASIRVLHSRNLGKSGTPLHNGMSSADFVFVSTLFHLRA